MMQNNNNFVTLLKMSSPLVPLFQDEDPLGAAAPVAKEEEEGENKDGNTTTHMVRRGALVPGKIVDEGEEADEAGAAGGNQDQ